MSAAPETATGTAVGPAQPAPVAAPGAPLDLGNRPAPRQRHVRSGPPRWVWRAARLLASALTLLGLWTLLSRRYEAYVLPGPAPVWRAFTSALDRGVWSEQVVNTLQHLLIAVVIILVVGLPLGIVIGRSRIAEDLARVPMVFLQTAPTIVLIALALVFSGTNSRSVVGVTVASGISYFLLNVIQGTRAIDPDLVDMARAYHASETTIMRRVMLPSVVPYFLAGSRITLGVCWQVTLFAEYLMGAGGIGFQVSTNVKLLDTASVFMWGLSVVALTLLIEYGVFRPAEAYLTRHVRTAER